MSKGIRTRMAAIEQAERLAGVDGLGAISFGKVAESLGISKSGLVGHFESKEELQIQILQRASRRFGEKVIRPLLTNRRRKDRFELLFRNWTSWIQNDVKPGGCLIISSAAEFDDQPGKLRDLLLSLQDRFSSFLQGLARDAIRYGEFRSNADPELFAYELQSLVLGFHHFFKFYHHPRSMQLTQQSFDSLLARYLKYGTLGEHLKHIKQT